MSAAELRAVFSRIRPPRVRPYRDQDEPGAGTAAELACALLVSVRPSDRALAGWRIEPDQLAAQWSLAKRAPGG